MPDSTSPDPRHWSDAHLETTLDEYAGAFAAGRTNHWSDLARYALQGRIANLQDEALNLDVEDPRGRARRHEIRGEVRILRQLLDDQDPLSLNEAVDTILGSRL